MNIRVFTKNTNRRTLEVPDFGVGNFTSQKEFLTFMKSMWDASKENPELMLEFKIQNLAYNNEKAGE